MGFFLKSFDKLKTALKKTADVLNTDVRTLFIPGRQIDDAFLDEMLASFIRSDMGFPNAERIVGEVRERWRLGKIKNAEQAESVVREQMIQGWGEAD
ncbi:MAG TPA: signal recognition particle receptor subunit alpha, partial [Tepidisphaeraceae bacterium]|nr:signal recognition particle receptor subunit alpha [Tepidisphaeraceae bacterium]